MKKRITAIPGSLMLIPMAISALVCTYYPFLSRLKSPASDIVGSSGTMTMIGLLLFFSGADSRPDILIKSVKRGGMLALLKMVTAFIGTVIFVKCFGIKGVMGVSAVAVAACLSSMSPGVYIALMNEKGDDVDKAGYAFISLVSLPFIPVCFLTVSEGSGIDWIAMISTGLPFLLGMGLALLKKDVQQFLKR